MGLSLCCFLSLLRQDIVQTSNPLTPIYTAAGASIWHCCFILWIGAASHSKTRTNSSYFLHHISLRTIVFRCLGWGRWWGVKRWPLSFTGDWQISAYHLSLDKLEVTSQLSLQNLEKVLRVKGFQEPTSLSFLLPDIIFTFLYCDTFLLHSSKF